MDILIGKLGNQPFQLTEPSISREHGLSMRFWTDNRCQKAFRKVPEMPRQSCGDHE